MACWWSWEKTESMAKFLWQEEGRLLLIRLVVPIVVAVVVLPLFGVDWWKYASAIFGTLTLVLAACIWIGQMVDRWRASLPKELSVSFNFQDRLVMRCERAYLASEADIRAWAQQLGAQMATKEGCGMARLSFRPDIVQEPARVERLDGQYVLSYEVRYNLREVPDNLKELFASGRHVEWKRPDYSFPWE